MIAPQIKAADFVTNAVHQTITIATVKSKHISWRTVFTVVRRVTSQENAQTTKKVCTEREDHVLDVVQFDTL